MCIRCRMARLLLVAENTLQERSAGTTCFSIVPNLILVCESPCCAQLARNPCRPRP